MLTSCSTVPNKKYAPLTTRLLHLAQEKGFLLQRYPTDYFLLTTYERLVPSSDPVIHIYIEGDGNSWKTKYKLSSDPTPRFPLALALALQDPHPKVIYLARPCQYTPITMDQHCEAKFWSTHRYAPEVIQSVNQVLEQIKIKEKATQFMLVGFSGGASIATLVSAKRQDIAGIITVAGDLDHHALSQYHGTTPLSGSLNPAAIATALREIPQHHWSGRKDPIVPPWVAEQFALRVQNSHCVRTFVLENASHHSGWEKAWHDILQYPLSCAQNH